MSRRIDIELTSTRDDGSWTWRAAGAREPKGAVGADLLPTGVAVGDVLRVEVEGYLDGIDVVAVVPTRSSSRREPERLELLAPARAEGNVVTTDLAKGRSGERGRGRGRGRSRRDSDEGGDRRGRGRQNARSERPSRAPEPPPEPPKPKPKRLRPARAHRTALLDALVAEQRPIAEQLLQGGLPAVRQAIDKQNESLRTEGKPEVKRDALLKVAEDLRPRVAAALWRDRAEAAVANVDDLDLRDLRSVVNAAGDAGRDDEARALAAQLREALANRVEKEHSTWLAELSDNLRDGRVVRALRLSSRPPKAGAIIPPDLTNQLTEATSAALTADTGQERWATVLDALAYSPIRRRVIPHSLPAKLSPQLREAVSRLGTRLPEIAHIFDVEPDKSAGRERGGRRGGGRARSGRGGDSQDRGRSGRGGGRSGRGEGRGGGKGSAAPSSAPASGSAPAPESGGPGGDTPAAPATDTGDRDAPAPPGSPEATEPTEPAPAGAGTDIGGQQMPETDAAADETAPPTGESRVVEAGTMPADEATERSTEG